MKELLSNVGAGGAGPAVGGAPAAAAGGAAAAEAPKEEEKKEEEKEESDDDMVRIVDLHTTWVGFSDGFVDRASVSSTKRAVLRMSTLLWCSCTLVASVSCPLAKIIETPMHASGRASSLFGVRLCRPYHDVTCAASFRAVAILEVVDNALSFPYPMKVS